MVSIKCNKCHSEIEVSDKRYKLCDKCKPNKKPTSYSLQKFNNSSINYITEIVFLIPEIASYLTIYETYSLYQTCKENKDILSVNDIWLNLLLRDFNIEYPIPTFILTSPIKIAVAIDTFIICFHCKKLYTEKCIPGCIFKYKNISKTECLDYYQLTLNELSKFQCQVKYNNFFRKNITLYNFKEIQHYVSHKYKGVTNFKLFRDIINNKKLLKQKLRLKNKENNDILFINWKNEYINTFNYSELTPNERAELLNLKLLENNIIRRNDSKLCKAFINGYVTEKSIDHIVSIIAMTRILFSYNHIVYTEFNEICNLNLEKLMFKNRNKVIYNWIDTVEETHNTLKKRFLRYNYIF